MSQEAPSKKEKEERETELQSEGAFASIVEEMDSSSQSNEVVSAMQTLSGQFEELTKSMEAVQKLNVAVDETETRAIQQINSESEATEDSGQKSQKTSEAVEELYDEERLEAKRELLEEHNLRIVQQLLASDTGALSPKEVAFRNENIISESTVRDHLRELTEKEFVSRLEPDVESIPNTMPRTFYAASPLTIELLQEMGLWENLGMLYQIYDSLDRPEEIQQIEEWEGRPSPDWI